MIPASIDGQFLDASKLMSVVPEDHLSNALEIMDTTSEALVKFLKENELVGDVVLSDMEPDARYQFLYTYLALALRRPSGQYKNVELGIAESTEPTLFGQYRGWHTDEGPGIFLGPRIATSESWQKLTDPELGPDTKIGRYLRLLEVTSTTIHEVTHLNHSDIERDPSTSRRFDTAVKQLLKTHNPYPEANDELAQLLSPRIGYYGASKYVEMIAELAVLAEMDPVEYVYGRVHKEAGEVVSLELSNVESFKPIAIGLQRLLEGTLTKSFSTQPYKPLQTVGSGSSIRRISRVRSALIEPETIDQVASSFVISDIDVISYAATMDGTIIRASPISLGDHTRVLRIDRTNGQKITTLEPVDALLMSPGREVISIKGEPGDGKKLQHGVCIEVGFVELLEKPLLDAQPKASDTSDVVTDFEDQAALHLADKLGGEIVRSGDVWGITVPKGMAPTVRDLTDGPNAPDVLIYGSDQQTFVISNGNLVKNIVHKSGRGARGRMINMLKEADLHNNLTVGGDLADAIGIDQAELGTIERFTIVPRTQVSASLLNVWAQPALLPELDALASLQSRNAALLLN